MIILGKEYYAGYDRISAVLNRLKNGYEIVLTDTSTNKSVVKKFNRKQCQEAKDYIMELIVTDDKKLARMIEKGLTDL